jgi:membrane protease subunit (stomatin/prohibitin family)
MAYAKDPLNLKGLASKIGLGLGDSKTLEQLGDNLNVGKIIDGVNIDAVTEKIKSNAIASVIKYEGDNTTFIWKHPLEDFNTGSQLIVHESQEALFYMNGEALDLFGPGRHTLETQNLPLVGRFFKAPTGGATPFHCEVYFINKTEQMSVKWGTDDQLEYIEPTYRFPIKIGASGEMSLRVSDARKLLVKLVGAEKTFTHQSLTQKFRVFIRARIKTHLASQIKKDGISIFEIDENLVRLSEQLLLIFKPDFEDYGLSLERFFITTILKPDDDPTYQQFRSLYFRQYADVAEAKLRQQVGVIDEQTDAQRRIIEAQSLAQKRVVEGYTYQDERGFDVAEKIAENEAVGQMGNLGVGLGVMTGVGSAFGGMIRNTVEPALAGPGGATVPPASQTPTFIVPDGENAPPVPPVPAAPAADIKFCRECGAKIPKTSKFCPECGTNLTGGDES